jgi:multidrug resistance efflux pump
LQREIDAAREKEKKTAIELKEQRKEIRSQHTEQIREERRKRLSSERALRREKQKRTDHAIYQVATLQIKTHRETGRDIGFGTALIALKRQIEEKSYNGDSTDIEKLKEGIDLIWIRFFGEEPPPRNSVSLTPSFGSTDE